MGRSGIEQLLHAMDQAFDGQTRESLLANLADVPDGCWDWVPSGGRRSVRDIVYHIAEAKYVYENHAFGDQSMVYGRAETWPALPEGASRSDVMAWLQGGQSILRRGVEGLSDDSELLRERYGWSLDLLRETRTIVNIMIQHDAYHAGEINHIRALAQGND